MRRTFRITILAAAVAATGLGQGQGPRADGAGLGPTPQPCDSPTFLEAQRDRTVLPVDASPLAGLDLEQLPKELVDVLRNRRKADFDPSLASDASEPVRLYVDPSSLKPVAGARRFDTGTRIQLFYKKHWVDERRGTVCVLVAIPERGTASLPELLKEDADYYVRRLQLIEFVRVPRLVGADGDQHAACDCKGEGYCVSTLSLVPSAALDETPDSGDATPIRLPAVSPLRKDALQLEAVDGAALEFLKERERKEHGACVAPLDLKVATGGELNFYRRYDAWKGFWENIKVGRDRIDDQRRKHEQTLPAPINRSKPVATVPAADDKEAKKATGGGRK